MPGRIGRYAQEIFFSFKHAKRLQDGFQLTAHTLKFHFKNLFSGEVSKKIQPFCCRLILEGKEICFWLRTYAGDMFIFYEIFLDDAYKIDSIYLKKKNKLNIIDLGANIGLASIFYELSFPESRFFCVEPNPGNIEVLQKNLEALKNRARILVGAADSVSGPKFFDNSKAGWEGRLVETGDQAIPVNGYSMEDILKRSEFEYVDILKMDIEGAEKAIFACPDLSWLKKVGVLIIELHQGYSAEDLKKNLYNTGFTVYPSSQSFAIAVSNDAHR